MAYLELNKERKPVNVTLANGTNYEFKFGDKTQVPALVAVGYIGADDFKITFDREDKEAISSATEWTIDLLKQEFNVKGDKEDLLKIMFPVSKPKKVMKAVTKTVKTTPVKTVVEKPKVVKSPSKVDKDKASSDE
tara:strand:- start:97 stop:501 length:405 start_codon:yes stop_codon:yes gene_type:complete